MNPLSDDEAREAFATVMERSALAVGSVIVLGPYRVIAVHGPKRGQAYATAFEVRTIHGHLYEVRVTEIEPRIDEGWVYTVYDEGGGE
jgi:hypothetical protein